MNWQLLPRRGISIGKAEIIIGAPRAEVRLALQEHFSCPSNRRGHTEDQYESGDRQVFMRYDDADTLEEIMCLSGGGALCLGELELLDTTWSELAPCLRHAATASRNHSLTQMGRIALSLASISRRARTLAVMVTESNGWRCGAEN